MFKVGDKVVCVNNIRGEDLKINNIYIITHISDYSGLISINEMDRFGSFRKDRFKLLSEFRKQKIEKICSKLVIK